MSKKENQSRHKDIVQDAVNPNKASHDPDCLATPSRLLSRRYPDVLVKKGEKKEKKRGNPSN
jgi:hypothetical protein